MSEAKARIDQLVSAPVWAGFPSLALSLQRWADLAGAEAAALEVSAVRIGTEWVSVRVSRIEGDDYVADWLEWLAPTSFAGASQAALDHFAAREMHGASQKLEARSGNWPRVLADLVGPESPAPSSPEVDEMAKKQAPPAAATAPAPATRSKPGPKPKAAATAPAPSKPGPKPKAAATAPAPAPSTRSKPKAAEAKAPAPGKKEGHRSTGKPRSG